MDSAIFRMVFAQNYENKILNFVNVMYRKLWTLFFSSRQKIKIFILLKASCAVLVFLQFTQHAVYFTLR